jgi:hypothetical protein
MLKDDIGKKSINFFSKIKKIAIKRTRIKYDRKKTKEG